ncbi:phage head closure protein [Phaeobacter sp. JH20_26]|uniref:phage head closure protein n=1 Tax=Phaeobacter sp. JH20_26 TaxID=3112483 RepID=UPI003A892442
MAGRLDRRIDIVKPRLVPVGLGEFKEDGFVDVATRWAKYTPVSDAEKLRAAAVEQKTDARFVIRYSRALALLDEDHKIRFDGSIWSISGVKELGRRRWLEFTAHRTGRPEV